MKKWLTLLLLFAGCAPKEQFTKLAAEVQPKAVMIEVDTVMPKIEFKFEGGQLSVDISTKPVTFLGAGVFISDRGHILSCAHLFTHKPINDVRVYMVDGTSVAAKVLYYDEAKDLSLVKIVRTPKTGFAALTKKRLQVGQSVLAVGNPLGLDFSIAHGIISAIRPKLIEGWTFTQDDVATNHGNSGGPLFNMDGELVGINTIKVDDGEGLSFAVSPATIREFLNLFVGL